MAARVAGGARPGLLQAPGHAEEVALVLHPAGDTLWGLFSVSVYGLCTVKRYAASSSIQIQPRENVRGQQD